MRQMSIQDKLRRRWSIGELYERTEMHGEEEHSSMRCDGLKRILRFAIPPRSCPAEAIGVGRQKSI